MKSRRTVKEGALPLIGITMGDPTGIGPEILIKAAAREELFQSCRPIVFGDPGILLETAGALGNGVLVETHSVIPESGYAPGKLFVLPTSRLDPGGVRFGHPDRACGEAMVHAVEAAVQEVLQNRIQAITTCPINKQAINQAGFFFSGHTELLAHLARASRVAMMFIGKKWKVVLITTHLPLKEVAKWITRERLFTMIQLVEREMKRYFVIDRPRIAVLGLNPHCGEEGLLGEEEKEEILPAIEAAQSSGIKVEGPFPGDSFFDLSGRHDFDVVIAMYHDQGLIPVKMFGFREAVNFTLGLPFIRTSVAHGTAYDLAGTGTADEENLIHAATTAAQLVTQQKRKTPDL